MKKFLLYFSFLLTSLSVHADYVTMKVGRSKKLALESWEYSDKSTDKLMAVWEVDNDKVTLSEMGLSGTAPSCWIKAKSAGLATVKCTYQQLIWDISSLQYKQTAVKTKTWSITVVEATSGGDDGGLEEIDEEMTIGFAHPDLHLWIYADKVSGEATIANAALDPSAVDGNSIVIPYDENFVQDKTNYWKNLVIPDTIRYAGYTYIVTALGSKAFNRTTAVETISLPESVRSIGDMAFNWCVNLKSVTMSENVRYIGSNAFTYCRELEYINLPDSLESLGYGAFADCKKLKEMTIPSKCKSIGNDAFMWCRKLHKLVIEDSEEPLSLGYNYDLSCEYDAKFYGGMPSYRGPFSDSVLDSLYLGRNVRISEGYDGLSPFGSFGANSFYDGDPFQYVNSPSNIFLLGIGDHVTKIPGNLLGGKAFLNEVVLPPHLEEIGYRAFYKALNQKEITIPETVTKIGEMAFYNIATVYRYEVGRDNYDLKCWPLRNVYCKSILPPTTEDSPFGDCTVYVPAGSGVAYREAWGGKIVDPDDGIVTINVRTPGSLYSRLLAQDLQVDDVYRLKLKGTPNDDDWKVVNRMAYLYEWDLSEANITEFSKDFFWDRTNLILLKLPESLTEICDSAFYGCSFLNRTFICPSNCTSIGKHAFANTSISDILFPNPINIGECAFMDCYNLGRVRIPSESTVGKNAFLNSGLKEAVIEDGVNTIESLTCDKIVFEGMVGSIGSMSATEMYVPDMFTWLKLPVSSAPHLYINGEEVSNITIPTEIKNIKYGAFAGCESLNSVVLPSGVKEIGGYAFSGCTNLQSINFPSSITSMGDGAFANCKSLTEIALPSKLTSIGASVFSRCAGLNAISYPTELQTIDSYAFEGCTSLTNVKLPPSLLTIGAWSFSNCSELSEVDIPESVVSINNRAFAGCPKINTIVAHWNDPITITEEVFPEVPSDCYLYIPVGTATDYFNAGWNFLPKLKEAGILDVTLNKGGNIRYGEDIIREESKNFFFAPYKSFALIFEPDDGYSLRKVFINGVNVTSEVEEGELFFDEPEENFNVKVVFADNSIVTGDVNGDRIVNDTDAICVVKHILKNTPVDFYDYAADVNDDDIINITDAIHIIKRVKKKKMLK